jgi:polyhydroxyalkanoate synthase
MTGFDGEGGGRFGPGGAYAVRDPAAFARNLALAAERGARALTALLRQIEDGRNASALTDTLTDAFGALTRVGAYWTADPARLAQAQTRLFGRFFAAWQSAMLQAATGAGGWPLPKAADRRFSDPDWATSPFFAAIRQTYEATAAWAEELVEGADLDPPTRDKARFFLRQLTSALSPANFLLTNPELLKETAATNAANLARGMAMLAEDWEAGGGPLRPRQTDMGAFRLGENLASTPGKVILQNELCQLIQYERRTEKVFRRPLLIVPPWINKYYVLDLTPEKSLVRWLVDRGHTVFMVSWVNPDARHADMTFEDYIREGVLAAVDAVETATGEDRIHAVGYCVGGTLLSVALALMAARRDKRIASATLLTAQVDFAEAGDLKVLADARGIAGVENEMSRTGFLAGSTMAAAFNLLRAEELIWPYFVNGYFKGKKPLPFDLLYWNADSTRMARANHSFYLRNCYLENNLSAGRLTVGGKRIDLSKVKVPLYSLATREDHIAPARSVFAGLHCFGGPVRFVLTASGHIAGVVNPPARRKYRYWTGPRPEGAFEDWVSAATAHPGSWWEDWAAWLESLDGKRVKKKRRPGGRRLKPIEDAPGSYVRMRG